MAAGTAGAGGAAADAAAAALLPPPLLSFRRRLLNVVLLGIGWCLVASTLFIQVANTSIAAAAIPGGGPSVATVPVAVFVVTAAASMLPSTLAMRAYGRAPVAICAACLGLAGACLELLALFRGGFGLLTLGAFLQGPSFAVGNNYRFMAAEISPPSFKPRAISIVVLCGVPAAVVGPEFSRQALLALPPIGGFVVLIGIYVLLIATMAAVDWRSMRAIERAGDAAAAATHPAAPAAATPGKDAAAAPAGGGGGGKDAAARPGPVAGNGGAAAAEAGAAAVVVAAAAGPAPMLSYRELLLNAGFLMPALICGASFMGMAAIMAMTPVRMAAVGVGAGVGGHSMSTWVVESHIVAMYLPGLLSADLIRVVGAPIAAAAGCAGLLAGNAIYYGGDHPAIYFAGMVVIGVSWHFAFVGASVAVLRVFLREPRRRLIVQGATDTVVISLSGVAIGTSSALATRFGWRAFIGIYMCIHGLLLGLACAFVLVSRRAAAREAAAARAEAAAGAPGPPV